MKKSISKLNYRCYDNDLRLTGTTTLDSDQWRKLEAVGFWKKHFSANLPHEMVWQDLDNEKLDKLEHGYHPLDYGKSDYDESDEEGNCEIVFIKRISKACLIDTFDAAMPKNTYHKIVSLALLLDAAYMELVSVDVAPITKGDAYKHLKSAVLYSVLGYDPNLCEQGWTPEAKMEWSSLVCWHERWPGFSAASQPHLFYEHLYRKRVGVLPNDNNQVDWGACINGHNIFLSGRMWDVFGLNPKTATETQLHDAYGSLSKDLSNDDPVDIAIGDRLRMFYRSLLAAF